MTGKAIWGFCFRAACCVAGFFFGVVVASLFIKSIAVLCSAIS